MVFGRIVSFLKTQVVRNVPPAAATSAGAINSHTAASDNSQASAEAIKELSGGLDFLFNTLGSPVDHDHGDIIEAHLDGLLDEAGKYRNSRVDEYATEAWSCPSDVANLVHSACRCSSYVYKLPDTTPSDLLQVLVRRPSLLGTKKAVSIWISPSDNALIVVVRGSARVVDHMVNLSHTAGRAPSVLSNDNLTVRAHSGYMSCAKALMPALEKEISDQLQHNNSITRVVFTGHSAGGAVASLLFVLFASMNPPSLTSNMSLITFGSPPVTAHDITPIVKNIPKVDLVLSFANELDMVARADEAYTRSIVDLYRSRFALPPVALEHGRNSVEPPTSPELHSEWPLPSPTFYHVGDIVVLKASLLRPVSEPQIDSDSATPEESPGQITLSSSEFGKLLFCDLSAHKKSSYLQRVETLAKRASRASTVQGGV